MVMHRISSLTMFSSILQSVSASVQGGFLHLMQQCVVRLNSVQVFNASSSSGGAISIIQESDLMITDSVFKGCSSSIGSIIYSVNTVSMIVIENSFFDRNSVQDEGIFYLLYSNIRINNVTFAKNTGGHFYFSNTKANISALFVKGGTCDDFLNTATSGGVILLILLQYFFYHSPPSFFYSSFFPLLLSHTFPHNLSSLLSLFYLIPFTFFIILSSSFIPFYFPFLPSITFYF